MGYHFNCSIRSPSNTKGIHLDCGYQIDVLIEDELIVELKAVEELRGIHEAQVLTYMKLKGIKTGLLINFNVSKLKNGIKRYVLRPLRALRVLRGVFRMLEDCWGRGVGRRTRRKLIR
jgi:GxxExxY protein